MPAAGETWTIQRILDWTRRHFAGKGIESARLDAEMQGGEIAGELAQNGVQVPGDSEMVALIAYLQSLGKQAPAPDDKLEPVAEVSK